MEYKGLNTFIFFINKVDINFKKGYTYSRKKSEEIIYNYILSTRKILFVLEGGYIET